MASATILPSPDLSACSPPLVGTPLDAEQATPMALRFKALGEAGLVTGERRDTWIHYRVVPGALADLAGILSKDL